MLLVLSLCSQLPVVRTRDVLAHQYLRLWVHITTNERPNRSKTTEVGKQEQALL